MYDIKFDDSSALRILQRLGSGMADFSLEMERGAAVYSRRLNTNFTNSASLYDPLAASTIANYKTQEKNGKSLIAPFDPLRGFNDSLRKAATALSSSVKGSAYTVTPTSAIVGIDPDQIAYARRALLGYSSGGKVLTPARDAIFSTDADEAAIANIFAEGIARRIFLAQIGIL